jgi:hypothetical protein
MDTLFLPRAELPALVVGFRIADLPAMQALILA